MIVGVFGFDQLHIPIPMAVFDPFVVKGNPHRTGHDIGACVVVESRGIFRSCHIQGTWKAYREAGAGVELALALFIVRLIAGLVVSVFSHAHTLIRPAWHMDNVDDKDVYIKFDLLAHFPNGMPVDMDGYSMSIYAQLGKITTGLCVSYVCPFTDDCGVALNVGHDHEGCTAIHGLCRCCWIDNLLKREAKLVLELHQARIVT